MALNYLMRIPLLTRLGSHSINTVEAHARVLEELGHVSIAKFGAPNPLVEKLQQQLTEGTPTYLILVYRKAKEFHAIQARIGAIRVGSATEPIRSSVPEYYASLSYAASLWFTIQAPFEKSDLTKLRLASNKKPILKVLASTRTPAMIVETLP